jgi:polyphosphate kinase
MENEQLNIQFNRIREEYVDQFDEELEMEFGEADEMDESHTAEFRRRYFKELYRLQVELVRLQDWVVESGHKLVVLFEGRDSAGKGGVIKRITHHAAPKPPCLPSRSPIHSQ